MSGRDPSFVENELFMRSQTHAKSTHPRQPWEQPGMLCVFNPVQAAFPSNVVERVRYYFMKHRIAFHGKAVSKKKESKHVLLL